MNIYNKFLERLEADGILGAEDIGKLPSLCDVLNKDLNHERAIFASQVAAYVRSLAQFGPELWQYITGAGDRHGGLRVLSIQDVAEQAYGESVEFHSGNTDWKSHSKVIYKDSSDLSDWVKDHTSKEVVVKLGDIFPKFNSKDFDFLTDGLMDSGRYDLKGAHYEVVDSCLNKIPFIVMADIFVYRDSEKKSFIDLVKDKGDLKFISLEDAFKKIYKRNVEFRRGDSQLKKNSMIVYKDEKSMIQCLKDNSDKFYKVTMK